MQLDALVTVAGAPGHPDTALLAEYFYEKNAVYLIPLTPKLLFKTNVWAYKTDSFSYIYPLNKNPTSLFV